MSNYPKKFSSELLEKIIKADDLKISHLRADGKTFGTPTWIWAVEVRGQLYVRSYNGVTGRWYQSAISQQRGRIHAAGQIIDVSFEIPSSDINNLVDEAYKIKYKNSPYLSSMISTHAKAATVVISPLEIV